MYNNKGMETRCICICCTQLFLNYTTHNARVKMNYTSALNIQRASERHRQVKRHLPLLSAPTVRFPHKKHTFRLRLSSTIYSAKIALLATVPGKQLHCTYEWPAGLSWGIWKPLVVCCLGLFFFYQQSYQTHQGERVHWQPRVFTVKMNTNSSQ